VPSEDVFLRWLSCRTSLSVKITHLDYSDCHLFISSSMLWISDRRLEIIFITVKTLKTGVEVERCMD